LDRVARLLYGLCLLAVAALLVAGGARLLWLGGSAYYILAGLLVGAVSVALFLGRWRSAAGLYLGFLIGTAAWAVWESGLDGWALAPRVLAPAIFGIPFLAAALFLGGRISRIAALAALVAGAALAGAVTFASRYEPVAAPPRGPLIAGAEPAGGDWASFAPDGNHFSPLGQITPQNVAKLKVVWSTVIGPSPRVTAAQNQAVPLKVGDHLYTCLPFGNVYELDPETGKIRWSFDAHSNTTGYYQGRCRGLAYYAIPGATGACARRLYTSSSDARLIALDALTGRPCQGFGDGGVVNLLDGLHERSPGYYEPSSGPTLIRGKLVVNAAVADGQHVGEPSGVIRAFDAVTGKLAWAWDIGRPGQHGQPPPGQLYTPGTPNSWAPMTPDEQLGLVYAPTGNSTPDYWGGHRSKESNRYASSVVALDAETGEPRWYFQTTHYDIWDYDVGSQPILFNLRTRSGVVPALIQPTKRGQLFILDRRTGRPLFPVEERPAPQKGAVERISPTQPWSPALPNLGGARLTERAMWGMTPIDQLWCRIKFREARYEGSMTPPGLTWSIEDPGYMGGVEWGSASIDEQRQLALILSNRFVNRNRLLPRSDPLARNLKANPNSLLGGLVPQEGTPFAADIHAFLSPIAVPCQQPPYGLINAVDLTTGKLVWSRPLGSGRDLGPFHIASHLPFTMGIFTFGGALGTQSGLVFAAGSQDHGFRAFDSRTGALLFEADLPASGGSTPISFWSTRSGRQFVAVSSEAPRPSATTSTGYLGAVTAFALPSSPPEAQPARSADRRPGSGNGM
jgi:quinoprotein glucose dehydrogenase